MYEKRNSNDILMLYILFIFILEVSVYHAISLRF